VDLRRPTLVAVALAVACVAIPALLFGLVLQPEESLSCSTHLLPGPYADALLPVHLAALAILAGAVAWLGALRSPARRVPRRTVLALAALAVVLGAALASVWFAALVGAAALIGSVPVGIALLVNLLLRGVAAIRRRPAGDPRPDAQRWADDARDAEMALWAALVVGVPASYALAYVNGASLFCF
jgi:hypothetical protein